MKIIFYGTREYDHYYFDVLAADPEYGCEIRFLTANLDADTAPLAQGGDAVCAFVNADCSAPVLEKLAQVGIRCLLLRCAGYNHVDLAAAKKHGITVLRVPGYSPEAVAEHAMALLLTINRKIHKAYNRTREFNFSLAGLTGFDLHGKTVGVIGTGKIGRIFADICKGFGMNVLAYDKFPNPDAGLNYVDLPELFAKADVISLHCPLTEETHHMIDDAAVEQMKKGVVIVNTSRGGLIDTESLINGIKVGIVGAACLDVYEEEGDLFYEDFSGSVIQDDKLVRLIAMPNVIVTSHQAFLTKEALDNIAHTTVENMVKFEKGIESPDTEVCYHCGRQTDCRKERHKKCF